ncbi:hypothetical protein Gohar_018588 [Gossypium harknessii]|uniref:Uncharacterized protein n=1 Tax=Gossypium harknessii TaxID=34285 RepID=A0A7J9GAA0_9ROSI|nr:hypothetical protein [Gossypium harknessii]
MASLTSGMHGKMDPTVTVFHYYEFNNVNMVGAYYLMQSTETKAIGDALGFGSAFLFSCVFAYVVTTIGIRLAATRKPIPAGPLLGLSICALVVFTSAYLQDRL